jgi:uncharacterized membrane protein
MSAFVILTLAQMEMLLLQADKIKSIKLHSAVVVAHDQSGKAVVRDLTAEGLGTTAVGAFIAAGLPLGPVAAMISAASTALLANSTDSRDEDERRLVEAIARELEPAEAVIVAALDENDLDAFGTIIKRIGGKIVRREQNQAGRT